MPVRIIAYAVPVTHAGEALRAVMLCGDLVPMAPVWTLVLMVAVLAPVAALVMGRSFRTY